MEGGEEELVDEGDVGRHLSPPAEGSAGAGQAERMPTHRFPFPEAGDAFDLLWNRPGEALGVLLEWDA